MRARSALVSRARVLTSSAGSGALSTHSQVSYYIIMYCERCGGVIALCRFRRFLNPSVRLHFKLDCLFILAVQ